MESTYLFLIELAEKVAEKWFTSSIFIAYYIIHLFCNFNMETFWLKLRFLNFQNEISIHFVDFLFISCHASEKISKASKTIFNGFTLYSEKCNKLWLILAFK